MEVNTPSSIAYLPILAEKLLIDWDGKKLLKHFDVNNANVF